MTADDSHRTPGRRVVPALLATALGLVAAVGLAEGLVRVLQPVPRVQIVRAPDGPQASIRELRVLHGQPVWVYGDSEARQDPGCDPGDRVVLMLGSSIFWGTSYEADEVVSARLDAALGPGWCVRNHAQPAFTGGPKLAVAKEVIPELRPDVVLWEVWGNDPEGYVLLGGDAYNLTGRRVDGRGHPVLVPFLTEDQRAWAFEHSALFEYAALALAPREPDFQEARWRVHLDERLPALKSLVDEVGARLVLVAAARLDQPFSQTIAKQAEPQHAFAKVQAWATAQGVRWVDAAQGFEDAGLDVAAVAHDACCHLNPRGHEALARLLGPVVLDEAPVEGDDTDR